MAHIIVTGATGLAGSAILAECLASPAVTQVSILSRRPVKLAENNPKAKVIIQSDYASYPASILDQLRGATGCIWAQGKSALGMSEEDYKFVTHDWPMAAAKAFADLPGENEEMKFVYISGEGADPTEKSMQLFARIKGRAETSLIALAGETPNLTVYNLRPGVIDPMGDKIADQPFSFVKDATLMVLSPLFRIVYPSMHTPTKKLAEVSLKLALGDGAPVKEGKGIEDNKWTLRNTAIRAMAGI